MLAIVGVTPASTRAARRLRGRRFSAARRSG